MAPTETKCIAPEPEAVALQFQKKMYADMMELLEHYHRLVQSTEESRRALEVADSKLAELRRDYTELQTQINIMHQIIAANDQAILNLKMQLAKYLNTPQ